MPGRLLDLEAVRCTRYPQRHQLVADCVELTPENAGAFTWLPETCAYRCVAEGRELPLWHPLVTGNPETVIAVRRLIPHVSIKSVFTNPGSTLSSERLPMTSDRSTLTTKHGVISCVHHNAAGHAP